MFSTGNGLINNIRAFIGLERMEFLLSQGAFRPILIGSAIWKELGWGTIIYLAALSTVDPQLYDAAVIDGAGPIARIRHITFPTILPVVSFVLCLNFGFVLYAGGEQVLLFYNPAGTRWATSSTPGSTASACANWSSAWAPPWACSSRSSACSPW